jgi:ribosomal protein S18 acetylase RimI-like enzyme
MDEVRECINSNYELYKEIVDPVDLSEHYVDKEWAKCNFKIREFFLAKIESKYVGMTSYQKIGNFAYIGYFYVKKGYQRIKVGAVMMRYMEFRTMRDKIDDLRLFCNPKSEWALRFYENQGFSILSTSKDEILAIENGIMRPFYEQNSYFLQKIIK